MAEVEVGGGEESLIFFDGGRSVDESSSCFLPSFIFTSPSTPADPSTPSFSSDLPSTSQATSSDDDEERTIMKPGEPRCSRMAG